MQVKRLQIFLSLLCTGWFQPSFAIPSEERVALISLYHATNGEGWKDNDNWLGSKGTECEWKGIRCQNGHVAGVYLYSNKLEGYIPAELEQLSSLKELSLHDNKLTGVIPSELGFLSQLKGLYLRNNQLSGEIPSELGLLSQLNYLSLGKNQLTGTIPPELGQLDQLYSLDLSTNQFTGVIPLELNQLPQLISFNISTGNEALTTSLPPEERLALTALYHATKGDDWSSSTHWLEKEGTECHWEGVKCTPSNDHVIKLALDGHNLEGTLPPELGQLSQLEELYLDNNQLTGMIPPELGLLSKLKELNLDDNQLTGDIPPELGQLSELGTLDLSSNRLTSIIPPTLGQLFRLKYFSLRDNQLAEIIPSELGGLSSLYALYLDNNQFAGTIPSELGQLSQLGYFSLHSNHVTGVVPSSLVNIVTLGAENGCSDSQHGNCQLTPAAEYNTKESRRTINSILVDNQYFSVTLQNRDDGQFILTSMTLLFSPPNSITSAIYNINNLQATIPAVPVLGSLYTIVLQYDPVQSLFFIVSAEPY
jgi:Leucine-rich repeat (LRR) protein